MDNKDAKRPSNAEKPYTATELRANVYKILDEVLMTGEAAAIYRGGETIWLVPPKKRKKKVSKLANLPSLDLLDGDPDDIIHMDWSGHWNPDLP